MAVRDTDTGSQHFKVGDQVVLRPGLSDKNGLKEREVCTVTHVHRSTVKLYRDHDQKLLSRVLETADLVMCAWAWTYDGIASNNCLCPGVAGQLCSAALPELASGRTALWILSNRTDLSAAELQPLLELLAGSCPVAVRVPVRMATAHGERFGTNPVHLLCARPDVSVELLQSLLRHYEPTSEKGPVESAELASPALRGDPSPLLQTDAQGRTPLHTLCSNPAAAVHLDSSILQYLAATIPGSDAALLLRDENGLTPLHTLLGNEAVGPTVLSEAVKYLSAGPTIQIRLLPETNKAGRRRKRKALRGSTSELAESLAKHVVGAAVLQNDFTGKLRGVIPLPFSQNTHVRFRLILIELVVETHLCS